MVFVFYSNLKDPVFAPPPPTLAFLCLCRIVIYAQITFSAILIEGAYLVIAYISKFKEDALTCGGESLCSSS
jgi:hypothetical protein